MNPLAVNRDFAKPTFRADFIKSIKEVFNDPAGRYERLLSEDLEGIEAEIPRFINLVRGWVPEEIDDTIPCNPYIRQMYETCRFWKSVYTSLPNTAKFARLCFTIVPSSAAAERVFSMLKAVFSIQQLTCSLTDYIQGSVTLRYNKSNPREPDRKQ